MRTMAITNLTKSSLRPLFILSLLFFVGCASLPEDFSRTQSRALQDRSSTTIATNWQEVEQLNSGLSGFSLVSDGRDAFNKRIGMVDLAEKTIDIQVYIWTADETGRIYAQRLIEAADRGVRVRILVDDMGIGATDSALAAMSAHPNIEIRIFNPFANRENSMLDFVVDLNRVNHRMHNKIVVADNSIAIVGGRNVGNHYYAVDANTNFRDLDIAAVGPIVRDISNVFDHFWAGDWAYPVEVLVDRQYTESDLRALRGSLDKDIAAGSYPYSLEADQDELRKRMNVLRNKLVWARGRIIWDDPLSIASEGTAADLIKAFRRKLDTVETSLTIESAYFVVGKSGAKTIKSLVERGVDVRILTNSLVSNDVLAAHAGHATYRKKLVQSGAELYELRADGGVIDKEWEGQSVAALHTKAIVFDDNSVFVGSFNLDPRSANINTEAGLYVENEELAVLLKAYMDEGVKPENSYRLVLDEDDDLVWITRDNGEEVRYDRDPLSTWSQRFMSRFIGIMPVESQL